MKNTFIKILSLLALISSLNVYSLALPGPTPAAEPVLLPEEKASSSGDVWAIGGTLGGVAAFVMLWCTLANPENPRPVPMTEEQLRAVLDIFGV